MSKKTELIKVFKDYKGEYESVQTQKVEIEGNIAYTEEGREMARQQLFEKFVPTVQAYHDRAVDIIEKGLEGLTETWRNNSVGRLTDNGYQAGLANVIKMLELGAIQEKDDLQNIVDAYAGDYNALAVIKRIVTKVGIKNMPEILSAFPEDTRDRNKQLLNQLKNNVDRYICVDTLKDSSKSWNTFNQGVMSVSASMDSMAEFVETKLGDNLELL